MNNMDKYNQVDNVSIYKNERDARSSTNKKKKKMKKINRKPINRKRRIRRKKSYKSYIAILILSLLILLITILSGRNKIDYTHNFYFNNEKIKTKNPIKISLAKNSSAKVAILSYDDIKEFFDKEIKYNKDKEEIITIGDTHVAQIVLNDFAININGTDSVINASAFIEDKILYLPLNDLSSVYGIEVMITDDNILFVDSIHKEKKVVKTDQDVKIKKGKTFLSKTLGKIEEYEDSTLIKEGKRKLKIRSNTGIYGYISAKKTKSIVEVRSDYIEPEIPKYNFIRNYSNPDDNFDKVKKSGEHNATIINLLSINKENLDFNEIYDKDNSSYKIFRDNLKSNNIDVFIKIDLSNAKFKNDMKDFTRRQILINDILKYSSLHEAQGIELILNERYNSDINEDLIKELKARLKGRGLKLAIPSKNVFNDNIKELIDYGI